MRWKNALFGLLTVTSILALVEGVLWIADVRTLVAERDPFRGFAEQLRVYRVDGDHYGPYPRALAHSFNDERFLAAKPPDGYRVFVLGGSSAYGFPWDARSAFARQLGLALQESWPERTIEVINSAAMSYASHRLRILTAELLDYDPDAIVVYSGHNEFIERRFYRDLLDRPVEPSAIQRTLWRSRLYSAMTRLVEGLARPAAEEDARPTDATVGEMLGFDVRRERRTDVDESERAEVREAFRENLEAIIGMARDRGVPVVLCTVPANLSGWVPNQSLYDPGIAPADRAFVEASLKRAREASAAVEDLERARELAPGHAEVHFRLGQAYEALGRTDDARAEYLLARDLDGQPARATSALNDTIRAVAEDRGTPLVDVERVLESEAADGLLGFNLFEDYVHPKPAAHRRIALALWSAFLSDERLGLVRPPDPAAFERAVGPLDAGATGNLSGPEAALDANTPRKLFNLAIVLDNQGLYDEAIEKYEACLELNPLYTYARSNLARLYSRKGLHRKALAEHERALATAPAHMPSVLGRGEALLALGRRDEAIEQFGAATRADPGDVEAWRKLGLALYMVERHGESEQATRRAVELAPDDADLRADLGWALFSQKKVDLARAEFDAALALDPGHGKALNGRGATHLHYGEFDEAERVFRRILDVDPDDRFAQRGLQIIAGRRRPAVPD